MKEKENNNVKYVLLVVFSICMLILVYQQYTIVVQREELMSELSKIQMQIEKQTYQNSREYKTKEIELYKALTQKYIQYIRQSYKQQKKQSIQRIYMYMNTYKQNLQKNVLNYQKMQENNRISSQQSVKTQGIKDIIVKQTEQMQVLQGQLYSLKTEIINLLTNQIIQELQRQEPECYFMKIKIKCNKDKFHETIHNIVNKLQQNAHSMETYFNNVATNQQVYLDVLMNSGVIDSSSNRTCSKVDLQGIIEYYAAKKELL